MRLSIKNLSFMYSEEKAIFTNSSFHFDSGHLTALIGHNASGKSTLAKIIANIIYEDSGQFFWDELEIDKDSLNCCIILQNPDNQFVRDIVIEDIAFGLENLQIKRDDMKQIIEKFAKEYKIEDILYKKINTLSGGQKQKVALVSNLILQPKVIILDESFSMIDKASQIELINILHAYSRKYDVIIIIITHNEYIIDACSEVVLLNEGKCLFHGTTKELFINQQLTKENHILLPFHYQLNNTLNKDEHEYKN